MSAPAPRVLYCHCAYAKVVPAEVKLAVLDGLAASGAEFDAVPDLCEMAARGDERLREFASEPAVHIAACYPRAVRWLFASGGADLPAAARIWNMRVDTAPAVLDGLLGQVQSSAGVPAGDLDSSSSAGVPAGQVQSSAGVPAGDHERLS